MTTKKARSETRKKSVKEVYPLADLKDWHDVDPPIRLGVFGDPVEHSLSPQMQNAALEHRKIGMQYARFHVSPDELREAFSVDLRDLRVLVLGAGGAARAIALQCAKENSERLVIANRSVEKAQKLTDQLRDFFVGPKVLGPVPRLQPTPLEEAAIRFQIANVDLIVNATPVGLNRGDPLPIAARLLAPHVMVYDTIYSAERTPFVLAAIEAGARATNGLSMLLHQGALAFEIWFQREAPIDVMRKALR